MTRSPEADGEQEELGAGEMPLREHLGELRSRLLRALVALAAGTVVGYFVFPYALHLLIEPYCSSLAVLGTGISPEVDSMGSCQLVALRPLEPFSVRIKTSVVIGLFVGGPVIFYQLWRFITPGLTRTERRYALPFVVLSQLMFGLGIGFAYLIIPQALRVLLALGGDSIGALLSATEYLTFFLTTSVAFGLVFELPLVLIFLSMVGLLRAESLRGARPYAVVVMVTAAAIITPTTDAVTLLLMAGPMWLFYELSVLAALLIERSRRRRQP